MFSVLDQSARLAERISRREWLRVGGLSAIGLSLTDLLRASETTTSGFRNGLDTQLRRRRFYAGH